MSGTKKNSLERPQRQSRVAILLLIWKYYQVIIKSVWPFFIWAIFRKDSNHPLQIIALIVILMTVLAFTLAVISYRRYRYSVQNGELVLEKGIIKRTRLNIPKSRVQSVNFEQNLILQFFKNVKVEIETAGSIGKELTISAIKVDDAETLRNLLLDIKNTTSSPIANTYNYSITDTIDESENLTSLFSLKPLQLLLIGLTENHLRAGLWAIGIFFYLASRLDDFGIDIIDEVERVGENYSSLSYRNLLLFLFLVILSLVIISIIRIFLKYYNLSLIRRPRQFKIFMGLLNRKEFTARDEKVQILRWSDNPLQRLGNIFKVSILQATSTKQSSKKNLKLPVISFEYIQMMITYIFGKNAIDYDFTFKIDIKMLYRQMLFLCIPILMITLSLGYYFEEWLIIPIGLLFIGLLSLYLYVEYRKTKFSMNPEYFKKSSGVFGNQHSLLPIYKIQTIQIKQSMYQRRKRLASIDIYTASGKIHIPYISVQLAYQLRNYTLYMSESSNKPWM